MFVNFSADASTLKEALESVKVKGKGTTSSGFGNSSLGDYAFLRLVDNELSIWNGDSTFIVKITITVEGEKNGSVCVDTKQILPYLKTFDEMTFNVDDYIAINSGSKKASLPIVVNHPNQDALDRARGLMSHIRYDANPNVLFQFGQGQFEGAFTLTQDKFKSAIQNCELVKNGVYRLNFEAPNVEFSSRDSVTNEYSESLATVFSTGEPATLEFTSPLYSFFRKEQAINFYVKDEFPLLLVGNDRMLLKAPTISG